MEMVKYNKSTINDAFEKYSNSYNNTNPKEGYQIAKGMLEYSIDNNDYTLALNIYESYTTTTSIARKIAESVLKHCMDSDDYTLAVKIYDSYKTSSRMANKIAENVLKHCIDSNDYTLALKVYANSSKNITNKIDNSISKYCIENNDYMWSLQLLRNSNSIILSKKSFKKIIETILESNHHNAIFNLYSMLKKDETILVSPKPGLDCSKEKHKLSLLASSKYKYFNLQDKILDKIKSPDFIDTALLLAFEAQSILQNYKKINFDDYPETDEALKYLIKKHSDYYIFDNYTKFFNYIGKLLKANKTILVLYLLNNYGGWSTLGDAKLWADKYIEAFVSLNRYDILTKYYVSLKLMNDNIEFLQHITQYFIEEQKINEAKEAIKYMETLEPEYPYIKEAKKSVEDISLINQMLSMNIDIDHIDKLSGQEFEQLLIRQFQGLGYKTTETPIIGDFGADIILDTKDDTRFIIQCKRFKNKVNLKAVQEVVGALAHFNGDIGIVITSSSFLNSAIKLAESNDIELWDKNRLMKFLSGDISFSEISTN